MMAAGIFWAAFHGNMGAVTNGLLDSAKEAVTLGVTMLGIMSFWCGILKIGERAGLIEALTIGFLPDKLSAVSDGVAYGLLILMLILKPSGLLGKKHIEKV